MLDARGGVLQRVEALRGVRRPGVVVVVTGPNAQRLERVALVLAGRLVRCELRACDVKATRCAACPMLERGWDGVRAVV